MLFGYLVPAMMSDQGDRRGAQLVASDANRGANLSTKPIEELRPGKTALT